MMFQIKAGRDFASNSSGGPIARIKMVMADQSFRIKTGWAGQSFRIKTIRADQVFRIKTVRADQSRATRTPKRDPAFRMKFQIKTGRDSASNT